MTDPRAGASAWRGLIPGVYLPSLVFEIGIGAMLPVLAVSAGNLGADLATAAVVTALLPIGRILADLPAGAIAARVGDRAAMIGASAVALVGMAMLALAPNLPCSRSGCCCWVRPRRCTRSRGSLTSPRPCRR